MGRLYYRWDYLKLQFEMEPDRFHNYLEKLDAIGKERVGMARWKAAIRVKAGGDTGAGRRRYWITVIGSAALVVNHLPFSWWPHVTRLDVKATDLEYTDEEVHFMRCELLGHKNPYNIVAMNSKDRLKNEKRDAGGQGFSIGSHKSDLRVAMYRRGREGVGLEFQCKDDTLERLQKKHAAAFPPSEHPSTYWLALKQDIILVGEQRFARAFAAAGLYSSPIIGERDFPADAAPVPDPQDPPFHTQGILLFDTLDDALDAGEGQP
jgi:hypothetical protein